MSTLAEMERALEELRACADEAGLRAWNSRYFGPHGAVQQALKEVGKLPKEQRAAYGQQANALKEALTRAIHKLPMKCRIVKREQGEA